MAPGELQRLADVFDTALLRSLLLEARLLNADEALRHGIVHAVLPDAELAAHAMQRALHIAALAPGAARINKHTLRQIARGGPSAAERSAHFRYADSAEHHEGIAAFIARRAPRFPPL
jgi:enoyl-CoA hydratase/carnithine racemase